ncbi:phage tail fiber protein [Opitutus terrae]|uniref:Uncharacterized protein n=1 Tax=Opitutus terrae (strain DSM 11246 / JCM 15787 / PB90-1) TaxID=452637 RepID=B1ZV38_OPITP|nr:hypothetical protein [Opitutus terrae]ACB76705.1 hypothetical protein Oter_3428 [Opitutus terrae PB90-1]
MSGFFTTAFRNSSLDHSFGGPDRARAANLYFAPVTTAPAADGSGVVEAAWTGLARLQKTNNAVNFPASANGQKLIATDLTFAELPADHVGTIDIVGLAIYEQAVGGTPIGYAPAPKTVAALDTYFVAANTASLEFNNAA